MIEKLRELKKKSHMTNQQIAEKSNIPESTVARIFSGKTPNPTMATVISMARAMGGSAADLLNDGEDKDAEEYTLDESAEIPSASDDKASAVPELAENASPARIALLSDDAAVHEKMYEDMISLYKEAIRKKDIWISRLFCCIAGIILFILFVLIFDILHPSFGFVKY